MIPVYHLSKEDRIKEIFQNILKKEASLSSFSSQYLNIDPNELMSIIEMIQHKIHYISEAPSFDFQGKNFTNDSINVNNIEDFTKIIDSYPNDFLAIYTIQLNPMIITHPHVKSVSHPKSYHLRGKFIYDPSIQRNKFINEILNEQKSS